MINISIIIPHLLDDDWLRVTIKLLQESSPEISKEIIVVDSGREIPINLDGYGTNIKILHYKRIVGPAEGRMIGAVQAAGEVFIFPDSHCLVGDKALSIIYSLAKKEGLVTVPCRGIGAGPSMFGGRGGKFTISKDKPWVDNIWSTGAPQEGIKVNFLGAFYIISREMFKTIYFNPVTIGWGGTEIFPSLRMASLGLGSYLTIKVIVEHVFKKSMPSNYTNPETPYSKEWNTYSANLIHFPSKREYFLENINSEMRVAFEKYEIERKDIIQKEIEIVKGTRVISEEDLWNRIVASTQVTSVQGKAGNNEINITGKKFEIIKATYGPKDVTSLVKSKYKGDSFMVFADNATFGDSAPNIRKTLNITYSLDGAIKEIVIQEKNTLWFRVIKAGPCNCGSVNIIKGKYPKVSAYCPTYGRPYLLEEAVESFLKQDYPGEKELVILNDYEKQNLIFDHPEVKIFNVEEQIAPLSKKYNEVVKLCTGDVLFPWDDDDIYLPNKFKYSIDHMVNGFFYNSMFFSEKADHTLSLSNNVDHCNMAVSKEKLMAIFGYDVEEVEKYGYKIILGKLRKLCGFIQETMSEEDLFYIYRWGTTSSYHGSAGIGGKGGGPSERAKKSVARIEAAGKQPPQGDYILKPHWKYDYILSKEKYFKEKPLQQINNKVIDSNYIKLCAQKSDINEHLPKIHDISLGYKHITEFGVRGAASTWTLLSAKPDILISYDIHEINSFPLINAAKAEGISFIFHKQNSCEIEIDNTDILFIDTFHTYKQLSTELKLHHSKVKHYIIMHDTCTFGKRDEKDSVNNQTEKHGLQLAITEFLLLNTDWIKIYETDINNGLTIIENISTKK